MARFHNEVKNMAVAGFLMNHGSMAETEEFKAHAKNVVIQLPELTGKVFHTGSGTERGLEIRGESCAEIQAIAEKIMAEVPFPKRLDGFWDFSLVFKSGKLI